MNQEVMSAPSNFKFPYKPYQSQIEFMQGLYSSAAAGQHAIFESPTGTGKSMSILCGIIAWLRDHEDRTRKQYRDRLTDLEQQIEKDSKAFANWFEEQTTHIALKKEMDVVQKQLNKIEMYDRTLRDILSNKHSNEKRILPHLLSTKELSTEDKITDDDDEFLLEEDGIDKADSLLANDKEDEFHPTQVFVCSRTHSQLAQLVDEVKKSPFGDDVRIVTLASRQNTCICPRVKELGSTFAINERCLEMQKSSSSKKADLMVKKTTKRKRVGNIGKCEFYNNDLVESLSERALCQAQDIEDLVLTGTKISACPYYASRRASKFAEIILAPYNTILHRESRDANGIDLTDSVLIVDEAHNLIDALCAMNGVILNEDHVINSIAQLSAYGQFYGKKLNSANMMLINRTIRTLKGMRDFLAVTVAATSIFKPVDFLDKADIAHLNVHSLGAQLKQSPLFRKVQGFAKSKPQLVEETARTLETNRLKKRVPFAVTSVKTNPVSSVSSFLSDMASTKKHREALNKAEAVVQLEVNSARVAAAPLYSLLGFLQAVGSSSEAGARVLVRSGPANQRSIEYFVLDPSQQFADIVTVCRSVFVAGGTMKPIEEFKHRLFLKAGVNPGDIKYYSWGHIIPAANILPFVIDHVDQCCTRFDFRTRNSMVELIVKLLYQYSNKKMQDEKKVYGGMVVFFTSYQYMNWVVEQTLGTNYDRPLFIESQEAGSVQRTLDEYATAIEQNPKRGAIIFCVMGGKLSEGINFKDNLGRLVILFGLPYPYQEAVEYKEKFAFILETEGTTAAQNMGLVMCMKTVNQCIGRAIRHKDDYAAVLLVDARYKQEKVWKLLPDWIQSQLQFDKAEQAHEIVGNFFSEKNVVETIGN